jgi:hypothetical protein
MSFRWVRVSGQQGGLPEAQREMQLPGRTIVRGVNASVVKRLVDFEPIGGIDPTKVGGLVGQRKSACRFDPPILVFGNAPDLFCGFSEVLVLAENQGDVEFLFSRKTNDIQCDPDINAFLNPDHSAFHLSLVVYDGLVSVFERGREAKDSVAPHLSNLVPPENVFRQVVLLVMDASKEPNAGQFPPIQVANRLGKLFSIVIRERVAESFLGSIE